MSLDEIKNELTKNIETDKPDNNSIENLTLEQYIINEVRDLRSSVEAILIFLKITGRMTEAQYRFAFSHVTETLMKGDETLDEFLSRSAIELEKKMKNAGLL